MLGYETPAAVFVRIFGLVASRLRRLIQAVMRRAVDIPAAMTAVTQESGELLDAAREWIEAVLPRAYREGATDPTTSEEHVDGVELLIEDAVADVGGAIENITRDTERALREVARRNLAMRLSKEGPRQATDEQRFDIPDVAFVDRAGKRWGPEAYARMVVEHHLVKARNTGVANAAMEVGSPGIRISDGTEYDDPCREANGQIWSVAYFLAHPLQHPNCTRIGIPLDADWQGALDRE